MLYLLIRCRVSENDDGESVNAARSRLLNAQSRADGGLHRCHSSDARTRVSNQPFRYVQVPKARLAVGSSGTMSFGNSRCAAIGLPHSD